VMIAATVSVTLRWKLAHVSRSVYRSRESTSRHPAAGERRAPASLVDAPRLVAHDHAAVELDDALAHRVHDPLVVGGHHDRRAGLVDPVEEAHDALAGGRVEVAGGLV